MIANFLCFLVVCWFGVFVFCVLTMFWLVGCVLVGLWLLVVLVWWLTECC